MTDPAIKRLFDYSDWANSAVLEAAAKLPEPSLDTPLDIGPTPGSLRRILLHTLAGETVWLSRWRGTVENKWPNELLKTPLDEIAKSFTAVALDRELFFSTLGELQLTQSQIYRDSRGHLFKATLRDMLLQGLIHSTHHRAQSTNAIRRLAGHPPELDFMGHIRLPADPT